MSRRAGSRKEKISSMQPPSEEPSLTTIFRIDVVMTAASGLALRGYVPKSVAPDFPWERELVRTMADISLGWQAALS